MVVTGISSTCDRFDQAVERAPRRSVFLNALVETFQGTSTHHRVRDVSATGARIDRAEKLLVRSTVLITVGSLEAVAATVIWVDSDAGIKFAQPIDVEEATARAALSKKPLVRSDSVLPASAGWINDTRNPYRR